RMLEQAKRALSRALLEARLHGPGLLDCRLETSRNGELLCLLFEHTLHRREERRGGALAGSLGRVPLGENLVPEKSGEKKPRRDGLSRERALVGAGERALDEALAEGLLEDHVEQRQHPVMQPVPAQALDRFDGVTRKQEL